MALMKIMAYLIMLISLGYC